MHPEALQAHVKKAANTAVGDDKCAVQVEEYGADDQHLAAVVFPDLHHLTQKNNRIHSSSIYQLLHLLLNMCVALLQPSAVSTELLLSYGTRAFQIFRPNLILPGS